MSYTKRIGGWMNAKLLNLENGQIRILTEALRLGLVANRNESK